MCCCDSSRVPVWSRLWGKRWRRGGRGRWGGGWRHATVSLSFSHSRRQLHPWITSHLTRGAEERAAQIPARFTGTHTQTHMPVFTVHGYSSTVVTCCPCVCGLGLSERGGVPVFEPHRGRHLRSRLQSQRQEDGWNCGSEKTEDGEREGGLSHHLSQRDQHHPEGPASQHRHCPG